MSKPSMSWGQQNSTAWAAGECIYIVKKMDVAELPLAVCCWLLADGRLEKNMAGGSSTSLVVEKHNTITRLREILKPI